MDDDSRLLCPRCGGRGHYFKPVIPEVSAFVPNSEPIGKLECQKVKIQCPACRGTGNR